MANILDTLYSGSLDDSEITWILNNKSYFHVRDFSTLQSLNKMINCYIHLESFGMEKAYITFQAKLKYLDDITSQFIKINYKSDSQKHSLGEIISFLNEKNVVDLNVSLEVYTRKKVSSELLLSSI